MTKCVVRWRPSGGRGEWEAVPAQALVGRQIVVRMERLGAEIPAEVAGTVSQGKPRLRKLEPNNRNKLHLIPLVMALARLPDPAREDTSGTVIWPLRNKGFIVSEMEFEIISDDGASVVLKPLTAKILHSNRTFDFVTRLKNLANDIADFPKLAAHHPDLAAALLSHQKAVAAGTNNIDIRKAADQIIALETTEFGETNAAPLSIIERLPPTILEEDIKGKEGRILTRLHSYRERDRVFVKKAKAAFKLKHERVFCECCGFDPVFFYGDRGRDRIQAHHRTPVAELVPDSQTTAEDLAMVCPNCHDIIHAKRPWMHVEELLYELRKSGNHYFKE